MERGGCVYIMTTDHNTVLYTGVTSDLLSRVYQHKNKVYPNSFSAKYNCHKLVYFEFFSLIEEAIGRENQLKNWRRDWKVALINARNPGWNDLYDEI